MSFVHLSRGRWPSRCRVLPKTRLARWIIPALIEPGARTFIDRRNFTVKNRVVLILLTALMLLVTGCHHGMLNQVSGSGNRLKQKRDVASFNSISYDGAFEIDVVCQQPVSLEIEGDDNILPLEIG